MGHRKLQLENSTGKVTGFGYGAGNLARCNLLDRGVGRVQRARNTAQRVKLRHHNARSLLLFTLTWPTVRSIVLGQPLAVSFSNVVFHCPTNSHRANCRKLMETLSQVHHALLCTFRISNYSKVTEYNVVHLKVPSQLTNVKNLSIASFLLCPSFLSLSLDLPPYNL